MTLLQSDLDLSEYPKDFQRIKVAFESYGFTEGVMNLTYADPPLSYMTDSENAIIFEKNPVLFAV